MQTIESLRKEAQKQGFTEEKYCISTILKVALPYRDSSFTERVIEEYHETLTALLPNVPGIAELKMPPPGDDIDALERYAEELAPVILAPTKAPASKVPASSDEPSPSLSTRTSDDDWYERQPTREEWSKTYEAYKTLCNPKLKEGYDSRGAPNNVKLYKQLGLAPQSSIDEVKKAFKTMALNIHPDTEARRAERIKLAATEKPEVETVEAATSAQGERQRVSQRRHNRNAEMYMQANEHIR